MENQELALGGQVYTGTIHYEAAGAGVRLCYSDFTVHQNYTLDTAHEPEELFQLGFCLEGSLHWRYPGLLSRDLDITENESLPQFGSVARSVSTFAENQHCKGLNILLEKERFEELIACFRCGGAVTELASDTAAISYSVSPKVRMLLGQMEGCDICESLRGVYLEGKVLELLAVYFDEVVCQADVSGQNPDISREDYNSLVRARDIIDRRYAHPLTINALARQVCLNEYKLKRGFKQCFGGTVLEYVVAKRMEMAQLLLAGGKHRVKDVAWMVGYSKTSHFINTYRKHFGITPGEAMRG